MSPYLTSYLRQSQPNIDYEDTAWILAINIATQGLFMIAGGILEAKWGPRINAFIGASVMSCGVMLTAVTIDISFGLTLLTYGFMVGAGCGMCYASTLSCAMRWHTTFQGLAVGLVLSGFALAPFFFNYIQMSLINPTNLSPSHIVDTYAAGFGGDSAFDFKYINTYFTQEDMLANVPLTFLYMGCIYAVIQCLTVTQLVHPPANYQSSIKTGGYEEIEPEMIIEDVNTCEMLKRRTFYCLWFMILMLGQVNMFISSMYKVYGQKFIFNDAFLSIVGSSGSAANAAGRVFWGWLADMTNFKVAIICVSGIVTLSISTIMFCEMLGNMAYLFWICCIYFSVAGVFSLFPTATAKSFGCKYASKNYGLLFTGHTVAVLLNSLLMSELIADIGWQGMFLILGSCSLISLILAITFSVKDKQGKDI